MMEAAEDLVAVVKPQAAYYERHGPLGAEALKHAVDLIAAAGALSLVDVKRGDYAPSMAAYGAAVFSKEGLGADAMTATAYLGFDALIPAFEAASGEGGAVFVVTRSSNPEGGQVQDARLDDGRSVAESVADAVHAYNSAGGDGEGPVGAVVGATVVPTSGALLQRMPHALILAPGVGVQGGRISALKGASARQILPSVSRSLLQHGPSKTKLREAILRLRDEAFMLASGET
jgi:orotidine-5'-phosphate decarboxylase